MTVVAVRDKFISTLWHFYVPADWTGQYWTRWDHAAPFTGYLDALPITDVFYGRLLSGQKQTVPEAVSSVNWAVYDATGLADEYISKQIKNAAGGLIYTTSTLNAAIVWNIPDGHDRIVVHCVYVAANRPLNFTLTGGTGLTPTSYSPTGTSGNTLCDVILTCDRTGTGRTLSVANGVASSVRVYGISSYDSSSTGDPTTAVGGVATGHDLLTYQVSETLGYKWPLKSQTAVSGFSDQLIYQNTFEFVVNWRPDGHAAGTQKWTSYGPAHYTASDAIFDVTTVPTLWVATPAAWSCR